MARVVIDARSVVETASGIGNYTASLLRHLVPIAEDLHLTVLRHPQAKRPIIVSPRVREISVPGETKSVYTVLRPRLARRFDSYDLYHSPADMVPPGLRCPFVVTLHDLMWVEAPRLASSFLPVRTAMHHWYRANFGHAIRRARAVIAISQATADAIERIYPAHAGKTHVIHHGVDRDRYDVSKVRDRASLDAWVPRDVTFSLAVGQGSPYKNHVAVVQAFLEATRDKPRHKVVLVRRFSRVDRQMRRLLARAEVRDKVIVHPHVPQDVLLALYRHARMLLFISHYEGFGMPAVEAMALGTPVLGSLAPAVVEVTGNAALHADASDRADIAAKIRRLDEDEDLRGELKEAGLRRIEAFSWEKCARETLAVYRQVLKAAHHRSV